jgi:hypothetical protein
MAQLAAFLVLETRLANPIFPLRMLQIRSLMVSSVVRGFMVMGMYATFFFGVLDLARGLGFGPMRIGLAHMRIASLSWKTTTSSSFVSLRSHSIPAPSSSAAAKASRLFSGKPAP